MLLHNKEFELFSGGKNEPLKYAEIPKKPENKISYNFGKIKYGIEISKNWRKLREETE